MIWRGIVVNSVQNVKRYFISGVSISAVNLKKTVSIIDNWIQNKNKNYIVLTGAHGVVEMQKDSNLMKINNSSGLTTPDGMSVVWVGRLKGHKNIDKVYAPDIMLKVFKNGIDKNYKHYFYGGGEGLAQGLKNEMELKFPKINIVGTYTPPFRTLNEKEIIEVQNDINDKKPDIVWVGLGCPKQEKWMYKFRDKLNAPVLIGVGAGFDFLSGNKNLASSFIKKSGFEWLFRLINEPKRLWPRYSRVVPTFLLLALKELIKFNK